MPVVFESLQGVFWNLESLGEQLHSVYVLGSPYRRKQAQAQQVPLGTHAQPHQQKSLWCQRRVQTLGSKDALEWDMEGKRLFKRKPSLVI